MIIARKHVAIWSRVARTFVLRTHVGNIADHKKHNGLYYGFIDANLVISLKCCVLTSSLYCVSWLVRGPSK